MQIREYCLPAGWFPRDPQDVSAVIAGFLSGKKAVSSCRAAVSPHAGWYYCGSIACKGISSLEKDAQTIVVIGGHLPAGSSPLFALEEAARTPFGPFPMDIQLRDILINELDGEEDRYRDNTVEVLLPMVRHFFPDSMLLWMRLPSSLSSYEAGKKLSRAAAKLNRKINVLASADLTHYGLNYGFSPKGTGEAGLRWMREVNDAAFIKAVTQGDTGEVLRCAQKDHSCCSAGAVLGAMGFADAEKLGGAQLLEYGTSADVRDGEGIPDSFVGYAALTF